VKGILHVQILWQWKLNGVHKTVNYMYFIHCMKVCARCTHKFFKILKFFSSVLSKVCDRDKICNTDEEMQIGKDHEGGMGEETDKRFHRIVNIQYII
jgi:hypothetical protein